PPRSSRSRRWRATWRGRASSRGPRPAWGSPGAALDECEEREDRVPGRALRLRPPRGAVDRRGAGDVAMDPAAGAGELAQEQRRGDGPAVAIAGLLHVGHFALDLIAQFFEERHAPHRLARLLQRRSKLASRVVVARV